jgi:chaperone protein DnaK
VWKKDRIEIVPNDQGSRTTPSWVAYTKEGFLVGEAAKNQVAINPENTVYDAKRILGRRFDEPEVQRDIKLWPFTVVNDNNKPKIQVTTNGQTVKKAPEEISAQVLRYMKEIAETYLGEKVTHAVITVPAYFNDAQRQATKDAGAIAGLKVDRILNEPTAAAMAYGFKAEGGKEKRLLVFDLGGGTFDVSLLTMEDGVYEVKSVNGDTHLGGQDFDNRLVDHLLNHIKATKGVDLRTKTDSKRRIAKIRAESEKAKRALSTSTKVQVIIDGVLDGGEEFTYDLSRAKFEELCKDLFAKTIDPVTKALADAKWKKTDVDEIILVGGSTRIPKIKQLLQEFFNGKTLNESVHPDEAVGYGAAVQAGVLSGKSEVKDVLILDVTPLSLGIETVNGIMTNLIPRNTMIPVKKTQIFSTASDNQPSVEINVYEGERPMAKDNHFLGNFHLNGIPLAPRGVPQIEVSFELDANGILTVTAIEKATGKTERINITSDKHRLSKDEIDRMVSDAEKFRQQDQELKDKIDARSALENYLFSIKNQMTDASGIASKIEDSDKRTINDLVAAKLAWLKEKEASASKEDFEEQKSEVEKVFGPIISKLYSQGAAPGDGSAGEQQPPHGAEKEEL